MTEQTPPDTITEPTVTDTQPTDWTQYIQQDATEIEYPFPDFQQEQEQQWGTTTTENVSVMGDEYVPPWLQGFVNFVDTFNGVSQTLDKLSTAPPDTLLPTPISQTSTNP